MRRLVAPTFFRPVLALIGAFLCDPVLSRSCLSTAECLGTHVRLGR